MAYHDTAVGPNLHGPFNWEYADETARLAAIGFVAADVTQRKLALQLSDKTLWVLTNHSPIAWVSVGGSQSGDGNEKQDAFVGVSEHTPITSAHLSFDTTSRVLTINRAFDFFVQTAGTIQKYQKTNPATFTAITDTSGPWYFYYDSTGAPISTQEPWSDFETQVPILTLYWNANLAGAAKIVSYGYEAHENTISASDHTWKHTYGSVWLSGFGIKATPITTGDPDVSGVNTCVSIAPGSVLDDNLLYSVLDSGTPADWTQDLGEQTPASITVSNGGLFKVVSKASGVFITLAATQFPFAFSGSNVIEYIQADGTRTPVGNTNFAVYWLFAYQDPRAGEQIKLVSHPAEFTSITNARNITWDTTRTLISLLDTNEIRPLYKLIYESRTGYSTDVKKAVLREAVDVRKLIVTTTTSLGTIDAAQVTTTPVGFLTGTNLAANLPLIDTKLGGTSGSNTGDQTISITGEVTASGSTGALTAAIDKTAITNKSLVAVATDDKILFSDTSNAGALGHTTPAAILALATASTVWPVRYFKAIDFDDPNNSGWTINANANIDLDATSTAMKVRAFDDTAVEGVGFLLFVPSSATNLIFKWRGRCATAPATGKKVALGLYSKGFPDGDAVAAWSSITNIRDTIEIAANAYYLYDTATISLATLGLTADRLYLFEMVRVGSDATYDTLVGDWLLASMEITFS